MPGALATIIFLSLCWQSAMAQSPLSANDRPPVFWATTNAIFTADRTGRDLKLLVDAESELLAFLGPTAELPATSKIGSDQRKRGVVLQKVVLRRAFVGDVLGAVAAYEQLKQLAEPSASPTLVKKTISDRYVSADAIAEIVKVAQSKQIVILNESHHQPRHRAFATKLAIELRKVGFEYIACEAFNFDVTTIQTLGYPIDTSGLYVREPVFGDFIRQAIGAGLRPIAYESTTAESNADVTAAINARETAQARNIYEQVFAKNPEAKVFIYVGESHLLKLKQPSRNGDDRSILWLAGRLKELTGIEPLTVDQVTMTDSSPAFLESNGLSTFYAGRQDLHPFVLRLRSRDRADSYLALGRFAGDADIQIFHPPYSENYGRADWLSMDGYRNPVPIPETIRPTTGWRLLSAFVDGEKDNSIPVDRVLLKAGEVKAKYFMLPKGKFRFTYQDSPAPSAQHGGVSQRIGSQESSDNRLLPF